MLASDSEVELEAFKLGWFSVQCSSFSLRLLDLRSLPGPPLNAFLVDLALFRVYLSVAR